MIQSQEASYYDREIAYLEEHETYEYSLRAKYSIIISNPVMYNATTRP
jgi:hypothetical protein